MSRVTNVVLMLVLATAAAARAAERPVPAKLDEAVDRALAYLARQQRPDGAFDHQRQPEGQDVNASGQRRAITGLCALAFLSAGQTPDAGRHGNVVRKAVDALADAVPPDGYVGGKDERPTYAQAVVTLALAEALGVEPLADRRAKQRSALDRLVAATLAAQAVPKDPAKAGGWGPARDSADSDLPNTCWTVLGLRAAAAVGVSISPASLRSAADFVARCRVPAPRKGFAVRPDGPTSGAATAAGALATAVLPVAATSTAAVREAVAALAGVAVDAKAFDGRPLEGIFWSVQAAALAGDESWSTVARPALDRLVAAREGDGGWPRNRPADAA